MQTPHKGDRNNRHNYDNNNNYNNNNLCLFLGVRVAVGAHQSNVDGLDHRSGRVQPLRGDLHAVSGDPNLYDATIPSTGARERH